MSTKKEDDLPINWSVVKLGDIADIILGQSPSSASYNDEGIGLPFFQGKTEFGEIFPQAVKWSDEPVKIAEANDVLISVRAPVGPTNLAPTKVAIGRGLAAIRPLGGIKSRYLLYALRATEEELAAKGTGTTFSAISGEILRSHQINLAPLAIQEIIVEEIETQFSKLDNAVISLRHMQKNLKKLRKSILKSAYEAKLILRDAEETKEEIGEHTSVVKLLNEVLKERRNKWEKEQLSKMIETGRLPKDDQWKKRYIDPVAPPKTHLSRLPVNWTWATLDQLADLEPNAITDGPFGSNLKTEHYTKNGPRVIRLQNIGDGVFNDVYAHISREHFESLTKHRVFEGDIVIAALGEILPRACIIPKFVGDSIVKADCVRFKPNTKLVSSKFVNFMLNAPPTRSIVTSSIHGVGRPRLNLTETKSIFLPLPSLAEQLKIIKEIENRFSRIESLEIVAENSLKRAGSLRRKILKDAFRGKLVTQNLDDESVNELLREISELRQAELKKEKRRPKTMKQNKLARRKIIDVLGDAKKAISPEQLFRLAGYKPDEVEEFYSELKETDSITTIEQIKDKDGSVYVKIKL